VSGTRRCPEATDYAVVTEQIKAGKLRALATTSKGRIKELPDVPTIREAGYGDYAIDAWYGLFAPAKTPNEVMSQFAGRFTAAPEVPEIRAKLLAQGLFPVGMCGADFKTLVRKQYDEYGRVIREANIKAE
jgi:tripartite-type tricarboxylate transporter receptor subunit TctC